MLTDDSMEQPEMKPLEPAFNDYRAYLLRLWREHGLDSAQASVWRYSLEDPLTHQRRGFDSLEALTTFLQNQITSMPESAEREAIPDHSTLSENPFQQE